MFGLGMPEILLILAIALIVIGPKKLPDLAKTLGRAMGEFKRSAQDFKRSIDVETTVKDIKDVADPKVDLQGIIKEANTEKKTTAEPMRDAEKKGTNSNGSDPEPSVTEVSGTEEPVTKVSDTKETDTENPDGNGTYLSTDKTDNTENSTKND